MTMAIQATTTTEEMTKLIDQTAAELSKTLTGGDIPQNEAEWILHMQTAKAIGVLETLSAAMKV